MEVPGLKGLAEAFCSFHMKVNQAIGIVEIRQVHMVALNIDTMKSIKRKKKHTIQRIR